MYKQLVARYPSDLPHYRRFGYFYLGALLVVLPAFLLFGKADFLPEAPLQWGVLVFLGLVSTALGMYWWNKGALPGQRRHPGGDEQPACASGVVVEPADLEPARTAGSPGPGRVGDSGGGVDQSVGHKARGLAYSLRGDRPQGRRERE